MRSTLFVAAALAAGLLAFASDAAFACNRMALTPEARRRHFDVLGPGLRAVHKTVRELPNGYEFEFDGDAATVQMLEEWIAGERRCCPFFNIDLRFEHDNGSVWLSLTGREGVKQFTRSDFASWFPPGR
ncbi:MAG TPA: hypothetical protein VFA04_21590 [Bryobacteraceae bacterium]|nr:hypothetical protein [Bryobacteraceae bacterium]